MRESEEYVLSVCRECGVDTELFVPGISRIAQKSFGFSLNTGRKKSQLIKAKYAVKYVVKDNVYIIWEIWEGRKNCNLQKEDYDKARSSPDCYIKKSLNYPGKANEKIYVLSPDKFRFFVASLKKETE